MLQRMLELPAERRAGHDTSSLRVIAASGSALPGPLATRVMDAFGDVLYNLYGSTEVAWASIADAGDLRPPPAPPAARRAAARADPRGGRDELPPGPAGRIFVGTELLFEGYTGGGDKARVGGLMATGDMGHFDAEGRLFVDGRDDDMIVSGGRERLPGRDRGLLAAPRVSPRSR